MDDRGGAARRLGDFGVLLLLGNAEAAGVLVLNYEYFAVVLSQ